MGMFHARRFRRPTQQWATELAPTAVHQMFGYALQVSPATQPVTVGLQERTVVVIDQRQGRFAAYDLSSARVGETLTGADSFYAAIVSQLPEAELRRRGMNAQ